jgi:CTP:phosphocholine cytidylyltransferase-like protein
MRRTLFLLVVFTACLMTGCKNPPSGKATRSHEKMMQNCSRTEKNGWIFVHLEGRPEVIGYQHGYLLANEILDLRGAMSLLNEKTTGKKWEFYREESNRMFWHNIPLEYKKELDGIVAGANAKLGAGKIDRKDILAMNSILEMSWYYVPWLNSQNNPDAPDPSPPGHCSAIAATGSWTTDGRIVMAHNNWVEYLIGQRWNIILEIVPEKGNRIIMDALPGFIHSGDDFNINSKGIIVTETTITQYKGFDPEGVAEFVRARKAIQYASNIGEWVKIMKENNNGGYSNDWLIGDNKTGEIARFEFGLKNQFLEITRDGYFIGANFPVHEKLIKEETTYDSSILSTSPNARKLRWDELMKEYRGKIDVNAAMKFMGDHFDTWRKTEKASGLTLCGHIDEDETGSPDMGWPAFTPAGAVQGKATDGTLAAQMKLWAIIGHPCGHPFYAKEFLFAHPEFGYQEDFLKDMPAQVWTLFGN